MEQAKEKPQTVGMDRTTFGRRLALSACWKRAEPRVAIRIVVFLEVERVWVFEPSMTAKLGGVASTAAAIFDDCHDPLAQVFPSIMSLTDEEAIMRLEEAVVHCATMGNAEVLCHGLSG